MRDRPSIASTPGVGSPDTLTASHFAFLFGTFAFWLPFTASTQVVEDLPVSEWVRFPLYLTEKTAEKEIGTVNVIQYFYRVFNEIEKQKP